MCALKVNCEEKRTIEWNLTKVFVNVIHANTPKTDYDLFNENLISSIMFDRENLPSCRHFELWVDFPSLA